MNRRRFIGFAAGGLLAAVLAPSSLASPVTQPTRVKRGPTRYRIHGNKKLGCSGFGFPEDPDVLENGLFMPTM
jgi:hypothetical protein